MKSIQCRDLFPGCQFHVEATTEAELLRKTAEHAAQIHGIAHLTDEVVAKVRGCIREI